MTEPFDFTVPGDDTVYSAKRKGVFYVVTWDGMNGIHLTDPPLYEVSEVEIYLGKGDWVRA